MQLHRGDVVDKAIQLLDDYGIADLTMRRLARELGVTPGALYWHFADKQALLGAVSDRILHPAATTAEQSEWADRIHAICSGLRNALLSATDGAELVSASFAAGKSKQMASILERLTSAAAEAGIPSPNADLAARTVLYYVLGFTADEQSRLQWDAAGALSDEQSILNRDNTARFLFGVELLIAGVVHAPSADAVLDAGIAIPMPQPDRGRVDV